jgi:predicted DNA binding CopG/RHH family protein
VHMVNVRSSVSNIIRVRQQCAREGLAWEAYEGDELIAR